MSDLKFHLKNLFLHPFENLHFSKESQMKINLVLQLRNYFDCIDQGLYLVKIHCFVNQFQVRYPLSILHKFILFTKCRQTNFLEIHIEFIFHNHCSIYFDYLHLVVAVFDF